VIAATLALGSIVWNPLVWQGAPEGGVQCVPANCDYNVGGIGQGTWINGVLSSDVLEVLQILYAGDPGDDIGCGVCCGDWSGFVGNDFYPIAGEQVWGTDEIECCVHLEERWHTYVVDQADGVSHPQYPGQLYITTGHSIGGIGLQQYGSPCLLDVDHDWAVGVNELLHVLGDGDVDAILAVLDNWGPCIPEHRWMTSCIGSGAGFVRQWFPLLED
jgi:hypothetical protein